jgi:hypothetical protein
LSDLQQGQLEAFRPAREAALCLDSGAGTLDVLSDGGKDLREKIASAFARIASPICW